MLFRKGALAALCLLVAAGGHSLIAADGEAVPGSGATAPEAVFFNARIHTMDPGMPSAEAVSVAGGRILAVGSNADILASAGGSARRFDLAGATVVPGLVDAHAHFSGYALSRAWLDLTGTSSFEEVRKLVAAEVEGLAAGEWVRGRGWDQNDWAVKEFPTRDDLDDISPDNPVLLVRVCGHAAVANSAAMRAAGIDGATPDPEGGKIVRGSDGLPSGVLIDEAKSLVSEVIPEPSREEKKRLFVDAARACLEKGLTGVHDMGIGAETASIYMELYKEGRLPFRITAWYDCDAPGIDSLRDAGPVRGFAGGMMEAVGVKFYMDGSLGARSAALLEDYSDDPGNRGLLVTDPGEMLDRIVDSSRKGFPAAIHAIGDRGNRIALDILEKAIARSGVEGLRYRIEHAQVLSPQDIPRFASTGVIPSMQFTHCTSDMPWAGERLGGERLKGAYAWRDLLATGVRIPGGSDFPVESIDPLLGIYAAVTRKAVSGGPPGGWFPSQCLDLREAVRAFTFDAALAAGQDSERGSISAGKLADMTVLDHDLIGDGAGRVIGTGIMATIVGGEVVYGMPGGLSSLKEE